MSERVFNFLLKKKIRVASGRFLLEAVPKTTDDKVAAGGAAGWGGGGAQHFIFRQ